MSSRKVCCYVNCTSVGSEVNYFHFPLNENKRKQWIYNCGNLDLLTMPFTTLQHRFICEKHFTENSFLTSEHKRLIKGAVPLSPNSGNFELSKHRTAIPKTYGRDLPLPVRLKKVEPFASEASPQPGTTMDATTDSLPIEHNEKNRSSSCGKLAKKLRKQNRLLRRKDKIISTLASHIFKLHQRMKGGQANCSYLSCNECDRWKEERKELALGIYCKSPRIYRSLISGQKIVLPKISELARWIDRSGCKKKSSIVTP